MKLLCLNVRNGGGTRWDRILAFVERHRADVVIFTEWRRSETTGAAVAWATSRGMKCHEACEGATKNGVFVASALPFEWTSATPDRETAGTLVRLVFDGWAMLAAYFPQRDAKARYFNACTDRARAAAAEPFLLMGDLNTGNQHADRTPAGDKYVCAELFDALSESHGLVDLWRRTHGADAREYSWMTKTNGFRLDHAFGNPAFIAAFDPTCCYDHSSREDGFTDHSALLISTTGRPSSPQQERDGAPRVAEREGNEPLGDARERQGYVVDINSLPPGFPTHLHSADFWEQFGRTVATFGHLEEVLGKAIFALTATVRYEETEVQGAFERWLPTLERALIDPLGGLIESTGRACRSHPDVTFSNIDDLLNELRRASAIRNVLCHGSWQSPDAEGRSLPLFVDRQKEVFCTPVDVEYLHQTQRAVVELTCHVINTVTSMGWQFPGTKGPGTVVYPGKTSTE